MKDYFVLMAITAMVRAKDKETAQAKAERRFGRYAPIVSEVFEQNMVDIDDTSDEAENR